MTPNLIVNVLRSLAFTEQLTNIEWNHITNTNSPAFMTSDPSNQ